MQSAALLLQAPTIPVRHAAPLVVGVAGRAGSRNQEGWNPAVEPYPKIGLLAEDKRNCNHMMSLDCDQIDEMWSG